MSNKCAISSGRSLSVSADVPSALTLCEGSHALRFVETKQAAAPLGAHFFHHAADRLLELLKVHRLYQVRGETSIARALHVFIHSVTA